MTSPRGITCWYRRSVNAGAGATKFTSRQVALTGGSPRGTPVPGSGAGLDGVEDVRSGHHRGHRFPSRDPGVSAAAVGAVTQSQWWWSGRPTAPRWYRQSHIEAQWGPRQRRGRCHWSASRSCAELSRTAVEQLAQKVPARGSVDGVSRAVERDGRHPHGVRNRGASVKRPSGHVFRVGDVNEAVMGPSVSSNSPWHRPRWLVARRERDNPARLSGRGSPGRRSGDEASRSWCIAGPVPGRSRQQLGRTRVSWRTPGGVPATRRRACAYRARVPGRPGRDL